MTVTSLSSGEAKCTTWRLGWLIIQQLLMHGLALLMHVTQISVSHTGAAYVLLTRFAFNFLCFSLTAISFIWFQSEWHVHQGYGHIREKDLVNLWASWIQTSQTNLKTAKLVSILGSTWSQVSIRKPFHQLLTDYLFGTITDIHTHSGWRSLPRFGSWLLSRQNPVHR